MDHWCGTIKKRREEEKRHQQAMEHLNNIVQAAARNTRLSCYGKDGCGKQSKLGRWILLKQIYWDSSYDEWTTDGVKYQHLICPKCGHENYIYTHPQKEKILTIISNMGYNSKIFADVITRKKPRNSL